MGFSVAVRGCRAVALLSDVFVWFHGFDCSRKGLVRRGGVLFGVPPFLVCSLRLKVDGLVFGVLPN